MEDLKIFQFYKAVQSDLSTKSRWNRLPLYICCVSNITHTEEIYMAFYCLYNVMQALDWFYVNG